MILDVFPTPFPTRVGAVVWNLAGGYRQMVGIFNPVVELHIQTFFQAHISNSLRYRRLEQQQA